MSYPPSSYLSPEDVASALEMARELQDGATRLRALIDGIGGGPPSGMGGIVGGRAGAVSMATRKWVGPHRDTFLQLIDDEVGSAADAERAMEEEAEAWAAFWADATNARLQRLHDLAMADHRMAMDHFDRALDDYSSTIAENPAAIGYTSAPSRPVPPPPPTLVTTPTAAGGYQPTG